MVVRIKENKVKKDLYKRNTTMSKNMRTLRMLTGVNQEDIANHLSLCRTAYYAIESGVRQPDFETLRKLAEFYNVNMSYIISYDIADQMLNMFRVDMNEINAARFMAKFFSLSAKGKDEIKIAIMRMREYERKFSRFPWNYEESEERLLRNDGATP